MNIWRNRIATGILFWLVMQVHSEATESVPNTPAGMLLFHWSAAFADYVLMRSLPGLVDGRLCDDLETLCLVSMVANFMGFIAYLAYAPPVFYNVFMWGLAYVQWGRLFLTDRHDLDDLGHSIVRRLDTRGA
jgi:hypothetical protein